ncbi:TetR/AcrR family transcriptional regulator [Lysinibacillus sp. LZ02]|uniref:TetR/AcrR family transcriptional regulator n=1 Tax=Lysinibacillus sp. LZ02 TaxID=3420668 RepID=UPI003D363E09
MSRKTMKKKTVTKPLIRYALITLLKEKSFEDITVHEIVDKALINRSTFYLHYQDKYDLYDAIAADLLLELSTTLEKANIYSFKKLLKDYYYQNKPLDITVQFLEHIHANADFYAVLLKQHQFQIQFTNILSNFIHTGNGLPRIMTNHIAYGTVGTIIEWLTKDTPYSIHYLANLISRLTISEILEYKNLQID